MAERLLVVISILEGRGFPKRPRHKIIAEARFDGELLTTDPADHVETPDFTQELAWELDKKMLQQHRLQRTSLKVLCFSNDPVNNVQESIGCIILDIRSAAQNKQVAKWYPLLHCKYSKAKPEVRLALYLEDNKSRESDVKVSSDKKQLTPVGFNVKTLVPVLDDEHGYYQLGPGKTCCDNFLLSVTIAYASNLPQLLPSTLPLSVPSDGFFFYYSLLGNDITNEAFVDLLNPNFPPERASVKVRSSVDALRLFLVHQPGLQVYLCCGDQSLGSCDIPLDSLLKKDSTEIYMKPVSIEGEFRLQPPNRCTQHVVTIPNDMSPTVGVSVVLRKEEKGAVTPSKNQVESVSVLNDGAKSPIIRHPPSRPSPPPPEKHPANVFLSCQANSNQGKELSGVGQGTANSQLVPRNLGDVNNSAQVELGCPEKDDLTTGASWTMPAQIHHFNFSLDLRSIHDTSSPNVIQIFLRYTYPFFGSSAPILTQPPVEIRRGTEVILPQSFCAFDFACPVRQLHDTFNSVPLTVEVLHRDKQLSKDVLKGRCSLPLSRIIAEKKVKILGNDNRIGWRQEVSDRVAITSADCSTQSCGEISMIMALEDWGPILAGSDTKIGSHLAEQLPTERRLDSVGSQRDSHSPRKSSEYQAALELELWKEEQQQTFEKEMRRKEVHFMQALADEWQKRDKEREVLMQKKMAEYAQWEGQLKKTLIDLERREKQLSGHEDEVRKVRDELQREHDRKLQEMKEASRHMKDDCDHQVHLERMKINELDDMINRYKGELQHADKKYKALEKEFSIFREQMNSKPEVRLQSEINLLTLEKVEVERKLVAASQSKVHYKQQWGRALKEVARLKRNEQEAARASLRQQQQELEQLRLRYLAVEEREMAKGDNQQLEEIKNELNKLKQVEMEKMNRTTDTAALHTHKTPTMGHPDDDEPFDEHISRLIEERDTLLRTGVYSMKDKIIEELDRQIKESIHTRNG